MVGRDKISYKAVWDRIYHKNPLRFIEFDHLDRI